MADIGAMLREARMRAGVDVSELEARTKIRAKYLRALEDEDWDLLPGPTFVKSFLRTYAEALGLDARVVVEEYKLRHERLSEVEMQPILPPAAPRERIRAPVRVSRGWLIAGLALALVVLLGILGLSSKSKPNHSATSPTRPARSPAGSGAGARHHAVRHTRAGHRRRRQASLQLIPTGPVYVCLSTVTGRRLINGATLTPGTRQPTFRARRLLLTLGNGSVRMRLNGHLLTVPPVNNGIGYLITARGRRTLPSSRWPRCA